MKSNPNMPARALCTIWLVPAACIASGLVVLGCGLLKFQFVVAGALLPAAGMVGRQHPLVWQTIARKGLLRFVSLCWLG